MQNFELARFTSDDAISCPLEVTVNGLILAELNKMNEPFYSIEGVFPVLKSQTRWLIILDEIEI